VAWLAIADQVAQDVGLVCGRELSERPDVVHWEPVANVRSATSARTALGFDDNEPDPLPCLPATCGLSFNPERRLAANFYTMPIVVSTRLRAVERRRLTSPPRLALERSTAVLARESKRLDPLRVFGARVVRWRLAGGLTRRAHAVRHADPSTLARLRAEPLPVAL